MANPIFTLVRGPKTKGSQLATSGSAFCPQWIDHQCPISVDIPSGGWHLDIPSNASQNKRWNLGNNCPRIRRPGSACTVFFSYVASKSLVKMSNPKSPVPQTQKISKIQNPQNPKSKIPKIQNPKSPKSKIQTLHIKICYIMFQKSKIQNPQNPENPKSNIPKIQNPKSPKSPKSKIQNPKSPKSKILNPQLPKSKIQNPRQNPKYGALGPHIKNCYITIQNPTSKIPKIWPKKFGLGILDFGFGIPAPKSKIQTPQNLKSKIPKI